MRPIKCGGKFTVRCIACKRETLSVHLPTHSWALCKTDSDAASSQPYTVFISSFGFPTANFPISLNHVVDFDVLAHRRVSLTVIQITEVTIIFNQYRGLCSFSIIDDLLFEIIMTNGSTVYEDHISVKSNAVNFTNILQTMTLPEERMVLGLVRLFHPLFPT